MPFKRKPKTFLGGANLPDKQEFTFSSTEAESSTPRKPDIAKRTKRRPHSVAFKRKPIG